MKQFCQHAAFQVQASSAGLKRSMARLLKLTLLVPQYLALQLADSFVKGLSMKMKKQLEQA
uniref:Uncharacterized protein n=1 Tax=Solanum lycopersicum TaxID=4081 RepID=K4D3L9_SOLLC